MSDDATLRVLVCDDHPLFRRAVVTSLEESGLDVVAEAATGAEAIERAIDHAPDVILMDLRMPEGTGIEATAAIRRVRPWSRVLVLTVSDDLDELMSAIRAGALGHLRKEESMTVLSEAVRGVHRGEVVVGAPLARALRLELERLHRELVEPSRASGREVWAISERQRDLLERIVDGDDLGGAANSLGIDLAMARTELRAVVHGAHRLAAFEELAGA
jgi:DNA-binding NarL/FixJ family response regulator